MHLLHSWYPGTIYWSVANAQSVVLVRIQALVHTGCSLPYAAPPAQGFSRKLHCSLSFWIAQPIVFATLCFLARNCLLHNEESLMCGRLLLDRFNILSGSLVFVGFTF